jgi:hypothetical protein
MLNLNAKDAEVSTSIRKAASSGHAGKVAPALGEAGAEHNAGGRKSDTISDVGSKFASTIKLRVSF